jgi:hypothetical protein
VIKTIEQESRLQEKMSKAKQRLPSTGKLLSFMCLKKCLHSFLWPKLFHVDLDTSNATIDFDVFSSDQTYRTYVMRCCLSKLRAILSLGIKSFFDAENMRQDKLQMILIDLHTSVQENDTRNNRT